MTGKGKYVEATRSEFEAWPGLKRCRRAGAEAEYQIDRSHRRLVEGEARAWADLIGDAIVARGKMSTGGRAAVVEISALVEGVVVAIDETLPQYARRRVVETLAERFHAAATAQVQWIPPGEGNVTVRQEKASEEGDGPEDVPPRS